MCNAGVIAHQPHLLLEGSQGLRLLRSDLSARLAITGWLLLLLSHLAVPLYRRQLATVSHPLMPAHLQYMTGMTYACAHTRARCSHLKHRVRQQLAAGPRSSSSMQSFETAFSKKQNSAKLFQHPICSAATSWVTEAVCWLAACLALAYKASTHDHPLPHLLQGEPAGGLLVQHAQQQAGQLAADDRPVGQRHWLRLADGFVQGPCAA